MRKTGAPWCLWDLRQFFFYIFLHSKRQIAGHPCTRTSILQKLYTPNPIMTPPGSSMDQTYLLKIYWAISLVFLLHNQKVWLKTHSSWENSWHNIPLQVYSLSCGPCTQIKADDMLQHFLLGHHLMIYVSLLPK